VKLSIVYTVLNQHALATEAITLAVQQLSGENEVELLVIDNGSETPFKFSEKYHELVYGPLGDKVKILQLEKNIGVYPTFWEALSFVTGDVVAYFHSDTIVAEKNWDTRVIKAFEEHTKLGLLGFIGSDEIDPAGGRGLGTASNFLGGKLEQYGIENPQTWTGSPAEAHGKRLSGYMNGAVVDGCAMILRRSVLEQIPERKNFPPHHFYDRMLSCEVIEKGFEVGVLGVGFDHISGQTVNTQDSYQDMAKEWCEAHGVPKDPGGWDATIYQEAEKQWLTEYRDTKHMVPFKV
jgi:cellulose synthase/poly-beta-1,6-N-acetylglucosamine synthase-like glycosyltransferase